MLARLVEVLGAPRGRLDRVVPRRLLIRRKAKQQRKGGYQSLYPPSVIR